MSEGTTSGRPPVAALFTLVMALVIGFVAWRMFSAAADVGVQRLARIDTVRAWCQGFYAQAQTRNDTMRVDRAALPDTIDPKSSSAIDRCGDLRSEDPGTPPPNPREMNGQEMPRGLR
ncbi:MAG TPA: hypothetical protein VGE27_01455 [Gemmatimonas sp.]|uniref:hypothetical protein n=1 Tax=Gemmatimonas sp. TaxID=1962908 RepID=UPI002EDB520F